MGKITKQEFHPSMRDWVDQTELKTDHAEVSASSLGLFPNTDITAKLLQILSDDSKKDIEIKFKKKAKYKLTQPFVVDLFKYSIDGNGAIFEFELSDPTMWAVTLTSSLSGSPGDVRNGGSPTGNIVNNFKNLILQTPLTNNKNCNGLFFNNAVGKAAHIITRQIGVLGFKKGVGYGNNAYMITNRDINVAYCDTCIALETGYSDMGERLAFDGGCIGDSQLMILNSTDQALHFNNVSMDFSYKFFENSGQIYITNSHIEAPERYFELLNDASFWGEINSTGSVFIQNSRVMLAYGAATTKKYIFNLTTPEAFLGIDNCHIHVQAQFLTTGLGQVRASKLKRYNSTAYRPMLSDKINLYFDESCTILPSSAEMFSDHNGDIATLQPSLDAGFVFTHKSGGLNSTHKILLPTRGLELFQVKIVFETSVVHSFFFNSIKFQKKINNTFVNVGTINTTFASVAGENTLTFTTEGFGFHKKTNDDLYFCLNTNGVTNGTTFKIKSIKVIPFEY